jgi:3-dehydroquinate dehydratase II
VHVLVVQGPNVNRLGRRGPLYGTVTLGQVNERLEQVAGGRSSTLAHVQSNSQGALIDAVQGAGEVDAILVNPGGLTNTGIALRDAIEDHGVLTAVVHVTNSSRREPWRQVDVFADLADIYVMGAGAYGYVIALEALHAPDDWLATRRPSAPSS